MTQRQTESCTILRDDALDALAMDVPNASMDLFFTDPSYNIDKDFNGLKDTWASDGDCLAWCYRWINPPSLQEDAIHFRAYCHGSLDKAKYTLEAQRPM